MNTIGGSVKSDGGEGVKIIFCAVSDLFHSRRVKFSKLARPTPPLTLLFQSKFHIIIGEYHCLIRKSNILVLISHLVNLSL